MHDVHFSSQRGDWGTPDEVFAFFSEKSGGFTLDAAADSTNALCPAFLGPGSPIAEDALTAAWITPGAVWLNPPYGRLLPRFVSKAVEEVKRGSCKEVWLLLPARTDTKWFQEVVQNATELHFLKGRLKFKGAPSSAPFPSFIARIQKIQPNRYPNTVVFFGVEIK